MLKYIFFFSFALLYSAIALTQPVSKEITIPNTSNYSFKSKVNNAAYQISIYLPDNYNDNPDKTYPVLFFLDGNLWLPLASSILQSINKAEDIEPLIMVGLGYDVEAFKFDVSNRSHDYTPTKDFLADSILSFQYYCSIESGGAEQFALTFKNEIIPFIDSLFRTNGSKTIVGHSLGGLFVTYLLSEVPQLFNNYVIVSPALWWDNYRLLNEIKEQNKLETIGSIYLVVGENETTRIKKSAAQLNKYLRKKTKHKQDYKYEIYKDGNHFSIIPNVIVKTFSLFYKSE